MSLAGGVMRGGPHFLDSRHRPQMAAIAMRAAASAARTVAARAIRECRQSLPLCNSPHCGRQSSAQRHRRRSHACAPAPTPPPLARMLPRPLAGFQSTAAGKKEVTGRIAQVSGRNRRRRAAPGGISPRPATSRHTLRRIMPHPVQVIGAVVDVEFDSVDAVPEILNALKVKVRAAAPPLRRGAFAIAHMVAFAPPRRRRSTLRSTTSAMTRFAAPRCCQSRSGRPRPAAPSWWRPRRIGWRRARPRRRPRTRCSSCGSRAPCRRTP